MSTNDLTSLPIYNLSKKQKYNPTKVIDRMRCMECMKESGSCNYITCSNYNHYRCRSTYSLDYIYNYYKSIILDKDPGDWPIVIYNNIAQNSPKKLPLSLSIYLREVSEANYIPKLYIYSKITQHITIYAYINLENMKIVLYTGVEKSPNIIKAVTQLCKNISSILSMKNNDVANNTSTTTDDNKLQGAI